LGSLAEWGLSVDLAPSARSYRLNNHFGPGTGHSTEHWLALARVWIALGVLALVCPDLLGAHPLRNSSLRFAIGFTVYSLLILFLFKVLRDFPPLICLGIQVNIKKHSGARNVMIRFSSVKGCRRFLIDDDGRGFDFSGRLCMLELEATRQGPVIIRERVSTLGGELVVESTPGHGARLEIALPKGDLWVTLNSPFGC
jgi:hypothetical protein